MNEEPISYLEWRRLQNASVIVPHFPKQTYQISTSLEACIGLDILAYSLLGAHTGRYKPISQLLEAIGLHQLSVVTPIGLSMEDPTTKLMISTETCYEAGKADAVEQRPFNFELIFGENLPQEFFVAYRRGYLEITGGK